MKVVAAVGSFFILLIAIIVGAFGASDVTKSTALSWLVHRADEMNRSVIYDSPEVQSLLVEIEERDAEIADLKKETHLACIPAESVSLTLAGVGAVAVPVLVIAFLIRRRRRHKSVNS